MSQLLTCLDGESSLIPNKSYLWMSEFCLNASEGFLVAQWLRPSAWSGKNENISRLGKSQTNMNLVREI